MSMPTANLIPRRRRAARAVARRIRLWVGLTGVYVLVLAAAYGAFRTAYGPEQDGTETELARVIAETQQVQTQVNEARAELARITRLVGAALEVRDHPDWGALLQGVGRLRGDNVVIGTFSLVPQTGSGSSPGGVSRPSRYQLLLTGLARDHRSAASFSLDLERTGVFSRVTLKDTVSQNIGDRSLVAFGIECTLDESGRPSP